MIAVTIGIGEYYKRLAIRASEAVRNMTGLQTVILDDNHFASSGLLLSRGPSSASDNSFPRFTPVFTPFASAMSPSAWCCLGSAY